MSFKGVAYSRGLWEKINPGHFDKVITLLEKSISIVKGEEVPTYTSTLPRRCLITQQADTKEELIEEDSQLSEIFMFCITWYDEKYLNTENRVNVDGKIYNIIKADEWPGRKRFVRMTLTSWGTNEGSLPG